MCLPDGAGPGPGVLGFHRAPRQGSRTHLYSPAQTFTRWSVTRSACTQRGMWDASPPSRSGHKTPELHAPCGDNTGGYFVHALLPALPASSKEPNPFKTLPPKHAGHFNYYFYFSLIKSN